MGDDDLDLLHVGHYRGDDHRRRHGFIACDCPPGLGTWIVKSKRHVVAVSDLADSLTSACAVNRPAGETGCVGVRIRLPLRVLLPCVAVFLAASGAAAIGAVCVRAVGGYVIRQADDGLRACASSMLSHGPVAVPGSGGVPGRAPPVPCDMELLSVSGQVLIPAPAGAGGPAIPASGSWLAAHLAGPVTVPGSGNSERWRVVIKVVHYQAQRMLFVFGPDDLRYLISGPAGHGSAGMLVVMAGLAGAGQPAAGYAAAAGTVLVLLAAAAFAVTRAILRPLREAARLAADAGRGGGPGGGGRDRTA